MAISVGMSWTERVHKQKLRKLQKSLYFARIIYCFQRKTSNASIGFLKVLCLETQMVCSGSLKNDSLCLSLKCSSKWCIASWYNGLGLDIQRPDQINFVLPQVFPLKFIWDHFYISINHKCIFFNWKITSSPYLETLLISMIKYLLLFFLSDRNVRCFFL